MRRHLHSLFAALRKTYNFRGFQTNVRTLQSSIVPRSILGVAGITGAVIGSIYLTDARSGIYEYIVTPLIRLSTDAEQGHRIAIELLKYGLVPSLKESDEDTNILEVDVFGTKLSSPVGLAAGLDKDGEAIEGLFNTGFSYVEIGSITPNPQPGNPKPRFFRLPKANAVINRYGFNSVGHFNVIANLKMRFAQLKEKFYETHSSDDVPFNSFKDGKLLGINLGKNKNGDEIQDYVKGVQRLGPYADVLVVNVSSPNTPGLRNLQNESKLISLLSIVVAERNLLRQNLLGRKPSVLLKIAPDLDESEIESIAKSAEQAKVDGIIVSNTTVQRPKDGLLQKEPKLLNEVGGLSGEPLKPLSLKALRTLRKYTKDSNITLIGCGGISSGKDALEYGKAGATFVQLYTGFAYKGPGLPGKIKDQLIQELKKEGKTWKDIIGSDSS